MFDLNFSEKDLSKVYKAIEKYYSAKGCSASKIAELKSRRNIVLKFKNKNGI